MQRKWWRIVTVLFVITVTACGVLWFSPAAQDRLLRRVAGRQMQGNLPPLTADTALRLVFCGTGAPFPDTQVAKSCLAVFAGPHVFVVDSGPESTENLVGWRLPVDRLEGVLLTHFHSDHIGDLGELNMQSWVQGRRQPLTVHGAPGVERVVAGFNEAYAQDAIARHAHHARDRGILPLDAAPLTAAPLAMTPDAARGGLATALAFERDGLRITAFAVDHGVVRPAVGYRFDYRGRSVVISGDTRQTRAMALFAKGADVLVHEAQAKHLMTLLASESTARGNSQIGQLLADTNDYHTAPTEAAALANEAGVRELVFTHFSPPATNPLVRRAFFRGVSTVRPDHWRAARDGFWIDVPADGSPVRTGQLPR
jgi:ribonuclease Z